MSSAEKRAQMLGTILDAIWHNQVAYNDQIFLEHETTRAEADRAQWTQQYLTGMMTEMTEILQELAWKPHRKRSGRLTEQQRVGEELVDILKYILCIAQIWGISLETLLQTVRAKDQILWKRWSLEHRKPEAEEPVAIVDLDGTLANWQKGFGLTVDQASLFADIELKLQWHEYLEYRHTFESNGGYGKLEPYPEAAEFILRLRREGWYIVICTARPYPAERRVWKDTADWLDQHGVICDELHTGHLERLTLAARFRQQGHPIVLLEDDPEIIIRAAHSRFPVWARSHRYNSLCANFAGVKLVSSYEEITQEDIDAAASAAGNGGRHAQGPDEVRKRADELPGDIR